MNKNIILYSNIKNDDRFIMTQRVGEMLSKYGRKTVFCPAFTEEEEVITPPHGYKTAKLEAELQNAEMIITFGGDGTILRAARAAAETGVPILGVNMGGKGFMAELEAEDIQLLEEAAAGRYKTESRMMINTEILRSGEVLSSDFALNDVVVKGDNKVIDLTLYSDDQRIMGFSGDGVVVATPTGSTAYSMSAGGPIVDPSAKNIIITPICAHVLEARSFVLVSDKCVSVEIGSRKHNPAYLSVDGGDHINIRSGDIIKIYKSERFTQLVRLTGMSFYKRVSDKLGERA